MLHLYVSFFAWYQMLQLPKVVYYVSSLKKICQPLIHLSLPHEILHQLPAVTLLVHVLIITVEVEKVNLYDS